MAEASEIEKGPIHTNKTGTDYATKFYDMKDLTVQKLFRENAKRYKDSFHLGFRPYLPNSKKRDDYKYLKYSETEIMVSDLASGLRYLGNNPQDKVGIMSKNCVEWAITDYATACQSMILVPVYDSYGPIECAFIITHSEIRTIICTEDKVAFICSAIDPKISQLRHIIVIEETCDLLKSSSENMLSLMQALPDVKLHTFNEVINLGKANPVPDVVASPDTILTIVYTSGTTGIPKGAVLTHNNCCAACCQISTRVPSAPPGLQDVMISYLPLAHILEKVLEYIVGSIGGVVGYFCGSMVTLADDIKLLRPTVWPGVPRVFSKIYTKIQSLVALQPFYKRWIFNFAYNSKLRNLRVEKQTPWADLVVFNTMRSVMGGRVRLICNGAAALPFYIAEFISTVFGSVIGEGYGLTECGASISGSEATVFDEGSVGHPYVNSEMCLMSIPEMGYTIHDKPYPRGEIMVRGPQVFRGYYKDAEATAAALEPDGWLHTGDVGAWRPGPYTSDGAPCESMHIIDRKKNIFKLAQGEFVSADKVESLLLQHARTLKQLIVYGNSTCTCLIAFVVPDWDYLLDEQNRDTTHAAKWGGEVMRRYWDGEFSFLLQPRTTTRKHSSSTTKAADAYAYPGAEATPDSNTGTSDCGSSRASSCAPSASSPTPTPTPTLTPTPTPTPTPASTPTPTPGQAHGPSSASAPPTTPRRDAPMTDIRAPVWLCRLFAEGRTTAADATKTVEDVRRGVGEGGCGDGDDDGNGNGVGSSSSSSSSASSSTPTLPVNVELKKYLIAEIKKVCDAHPDKIKRYEIPQGVVVCETEWTDFNGLLTPSLKIKREAVRARYKRAYEEELRRVEREVVEKDKKEKN